jgi:hypothetical protein
MATNITMMRQAGDAIARILAGENILIYMYIEFENMDSPGNNPTGSVADIDNDVTYFTGLGAGRDFIRIAVLKPSQTNASAVEYSNNRVTFIGQVLDETNGVNGNEVFGTDGASIFSYIYGAAIVAVPDVNDVTKDLIIARSYFTALEQVIDTAVTVTFPLDFEVNE